MLSGFETVGTQTLPPDPSIAEAIGLSHNLESALADLVDNSIDAAATRVRLRFVLRSGLIHQLVVVDDGRGMDATQITEAMRLGARSERQSRSLGHFGVGMKAATFSQASVLTVLSRTVNGPAVGRRLFRENDQAAFEVDELASDQVRSALDSFANEFEERPGTVVIWDQIRTFPKSKKRVVTERFIEGAVGRLRHHLGLIFHRLLERRAIRIDIDVHDLDTVETGFPFEVVPIDPFGYTRSGSETYPRTLTARIDSESIPLSCHIWPGKSDSPSFKLAGLTLDDTQGFYLYRHDRLLSAGGWGGIVNKTKQRRLARVAIDIERFEDLFQMSAEKATVHFAADAVHAIELATCSARTTFAEYLGVAESTFKASNQRVAKRTPLLPPGQGISPRVKRAINNEVVVIEGEEPVRIRWRTFQNKDFVEVDRDNRTLWLNPDYRSAVLGGRHGGVNDAPLLKALLYLVYEDIFRGAAYGARDKDNVNMWREILNAAAREELDGYDG